MSAVASMVTVMTDTPTSPISISLDGSSEDYEDPELAGALSFMIEQQGLLQTLVAGLSSFSPTRRSGD